MAFPLPFRAVEYDEDGTAFVDYLYERATYITDTPTQARQLAQRAWLYVQQHDHLRDDHHQSGHVGEPTVEQYAERWRLPIRNAYREFAEFERLFPGEDDPGRVCAELWEGIGRQTNRTGMLMPVRAVKVAPS